MFPEFHPRLSKLHPKDRLAARGEILAARKLRRKGYKILARRWRWRRFEIDLVACRGKVLAVVEVKTRSDDKFGLPQEAVPYWKQKRIVAAGNVYAAKNKLGDCLLRFDVVAILAVENKKPIIDHIENAFQA